MLLKGFIWDFLGKGANQIVSFVVSIILARILGPSEFGLLGMAMVVISIAQAFGDLGFSSGVIQSNKVSKIQYNTIFFINVGVGIFLTILTFASSSLIADFYKREDIMPIFNLLSLLFIINSFSNLPMALLKRKVDFKSIAVINLVSVFVSGVVGIAMAFNGYGVFAMVIQSLIQYLLISVIVWKFIDWRPSMNLKKNFSLGSIKDIWKFSSNLFYAGLLDVIFSRIDVMIIGKIFSATILGYYTRSVSFYNLIIRYSSGSIAQVFFPVISRMQDDKSSVRQLTLKSLHAIGFTIFFLIGFFYLISDEFVLILLSEKWMQSSIYFKILLLSAFSRPIGITMVNVLTGMGNSKTHFRIEIVKKLLLLITYIVGFQFGIIGFLYSLIVNRSLATIINIYYGGREIDLSFIKIVTTLTSYFSFGIIAYFITFYIYESFLFDSNIYIALILKSFVFVIIYLGFNYVFKQKGLVLLMEMIFRLKKKI